jgi:hypothetical protein
MSTPETVRHERLVEVETTSSKARAARSTEARGPIPTAAWWTPEATDPKPKLHYTAGSTARRVTALRRYIPARAFDRQIRKLNHLPA